MILIGCLYLIAVSLGTVQSMALYDGGLLRAILLNMLLYGVALGIVLGAVYALGGWV